MPRAAAAVLPQVGTLVEGPAAYAHLTGRANLELFDAMGVGSTGPGDSGSPTCWSGSGSASPAGAR